MRIIYVTHSLPFGPGEAFVIPEVLELITQGNEVRVVPLRKLGEVRHEDAKALIEITVARSLLSADILVSAAIEWLRRPYRATRALSKVLPGHSGWTLIKHLSACPKALWLARLCRRWKADHIHAHWATVTATAAMVASEVSGIPWSFTAHRYDIVANQSLTRKAAHASFVRFISKSGIELARRFGFHAPAGKAVVIHMGVALPTNHNDAPSLDIKNKLSASDSPVVLCPASLLPVKGHTHLISALALLRDRGLPFEAWLVGEGPSRRDIEQQIEEVKLSECVRLLGLMPHSALMNLYGQRKVTVVTLPSVDLGGGLHEGIPVGLIEAMAYAIPVVSTRTGGIPELLEAGAGELVPAGDPRAMADAIERLLSDATLRAATARRGQLRVEEEFSVEAIVRRLTQRFAAFSCDADRCERN